MKYHLLKSFALSALVMLGASAFAQEKSVTTSTGDNWVRMDNTGKNNGTDYKVEIKTYTDNNAEGGPAAKNFYGLMSFEFTKPDAGNEVKSAVLQLTTWVARGNHDMVVYAVKGDFNPDDVNYNDVKDNVETALLTEPIAKFSLNGMNGKALTDTGLTEEWLDVNKWKNTIDLTSYVRTLSGNKFTILIAKATEENSSSCIYTNNYNETNATWNANIANIGGQTIAKEDIIPQLTVEYQEATGQYSKTSLPTADTYVRKGNTSDNSAKANMEIYTLKNDDKDLDFVGLMSFAVPADVLDADNYELKSATLRLVSQRVKGDRNVSIYNLDGTFAETAVYADVETLLAAARATTPIAQFEAKGQGNKDITIDPVTTDYRTAEAWTSTIDLTEYVKTLTTASFNIVIAADANSDQAKMFFTKEAVEFTNAKDTENGAFTISAEDIVPQLTVVYTKKDNGGYVLNVTEAGAATLVLPYETTIPEGVKVYTLTEVKNTEITAKEMTSATLAANTPVLVNAEQGNYMFNAVNGVADATDNTVKVDGNLLTGVYEETTVPNGSYLLTNHENSVAFRMSDGTNKVAAYHAYLTLPAGTSSNAKQLSIVYGGDGDTTGLNSAETSTGKQTEKAIYTLQGVKVKDMSAKGIYIVNGKKIIVK